MQYKDTRISWSILTDVPILYQGKAGVIVHWHGFATNMKTALIVSNYFIGNGAYSTPRMRDEAWNEFNAMVHMGDFPDAPKWGISHFTNSTEYVKYVNKYMSPHFLKMTDNGRLRKTAAEVLGWFDKNNISEVVNDTNS
jgi:hypothetical protein